MHKADHRMCRVVIACVRVSEEDKGHSETFIFCISESFICSCKVLSQLINSTEMKEFYSVVVFVTPECFSPFVSEMISGVSTLEHSVNHLVTIVKVLACLH